MKIFLLNKKPRIRHYYVVHFFSQLMSNIVVPQYLLLICSRTHDKCQNQRSTKQVTSAEIFSLAGRRSGSYKSQQAWWVLSKYQVLQHVFSSSKWDENSVQGVLKPMSTDVWLYNQISIIRHSKKIKGIHILHLIDAQICERFIKCIYLYQL